VSLRSRARCVGRYRVSWSKLIAASGTLAMSSHCVPHRPVVVLDYSPDLHLVLTLPPNRDNRLNQTVSLHLLVCPTAPLLSPPMRRAGRGIPRTSRARSSRRRASYLAGKSGEGNHPEHRSRPPPRLRQPQDRTLRPRRGPGAGTQRRRIGTVLHSRLRSPRAVCEDPLRRLIRRIRHSRTPRPLCQMCRSGWRRAIWGMARTGTGTGAIGTRPQRQRRLGAGRGI
jgi:hypothetical protein